MYHYDALGDERFQELCQALIVAAFPNTQCLPTGQPDGGRDAYLLNHVLNGRRGRPSEPEVIVYQVKYVKNAADSRSEREMIEAVVRSEKAKVDKFKGKGLKKYYLITNLKGTAHPEVGSIDKVNSLLSRELGIEAYCWWRDDLDRRLDANASIKWSYPEILKATDLLQKLVEGQIGEDEERRRSAIRAYMTAQFDEDQELKFKQTELRSTMAELFVDLPMRISDRALVHDDNYRRMRRRRYIDRNWEYLDYLTYHGGEEHIRAAEFFISQKHRDDIAKVVLEGAPGQGKSTVTQYVCQVLRTKLLDKETDSKGLPPYCQNAPIRIPFRVDLRDLAKWISGVDPFQPTQVDLPAQEPRSLEGFLAGQVRFLSGGHDFNVSDLTAVARASHMLLALDGFDEVADIALRQSLVDEISKGTNRLSTSGSFTLQTIVTSRPAAFAKSVRFPPDSWTYLELLPLERKNVDEYTTKWMVAKGLKDSEQAQLRSILNTKLKESHTQYLAKNPMQLTILLSLINSRGASLPEKRTAMYDAYMEMFFSRESEKSEIVRDNRDILIDIHRYLAWKLQTSAESGENGSIDQISLRTTLYSYLFKEGEDTTIVEALFDGIIERVGALVSRVQGTYEFEVQPLREYFAARHLYETAPYPANDIELPGDKLDRFNALVRNPYWLNVARFYGGCFNKGEIMTLVNELIELSNDKLVSLTSHSRSFALMLLSDWVFSQYQPAVKAVIAFVTERPQFIQLLANAEETGTSYWSGLPDRSGRIEFLNVLWSYAAQAPASDQMRALAHAICENSSLEERVQRWTAYARNMPDAQWVYLGELLEIFSSATISSVPAASEDRPIIVEALLRARQFAELERSARFESAKSTLLHEIVTATSAITREDHSRLAWLARQISCYQYTIVFHEETGLPLREHLSRRMYASRVLVSEDLAMRNIGVDDLPEPDRASVQAYLQFLECETQILATTLQPWADLVETLRSTWGDCRAIDRIAFLAAGVRSSAESGCDGSLAQTNALVQSARYIRLKSGAPQWWKDKIQSESDQVARRRLLHLMALWATPKTIMKISAAIDEALASLDDKQWSFLVRDYQATRIRSSRREDVPHLGGAEGKQFCASSPRFQTFLGPRFSRSVRLRSALEIAKHDTLGSPERQFAFQTFAEVSRADSQWQSVLPSVEKLYAYGTSGSFTLGRETTMPTDIAEAISSRPERFPLSWAALADGSLRSVAGANAPKLLEIAKRDLWFRDETGGVQ